MYKNLICLFFAYLSILRKIYFQKQYLISIHTFNIYLQARKIWFFSRQPEKRHAWSEKTVTRLIFLILNFLTISPRINVAPGPVLQLWRLWGKNGINYICISFVFLSYFWKIPLMPIKSTKKRVAEKQQAAKEATTSTPGETREQTTKFTCLPFAFLYFFLYFPLYFFLYLQI